MREKASGGFESDYLPFVGCETLGSQQPRQDDLFTIFPAGVATPFDVKIVGVKGREGDFSFIAKRIGRRNEEENTSKVSLGHGTAARRI